jgi:hypothetical protein
MAVTTKSEGFWFVAPRSLHSPMFRRNLLAPSFSYPSSTILPASICFLNVIHFDIEDGGDILARNVGIFPNNATLTFKRPCSSQLFFVVYVKNYLKVSKYFGVTIFNSDSYPEVDGSSLKDTHETIRWHSEQNINFYNGKR